VTEIFGIPMDELSVALAVAVAAAVALVAAMAMRNRIFMRLAIKNVSRRRGRSALIVAGLMLGTAIVAAALATGDTMSQAIRSTAITSLGQTDELVSVKGADAALDTESGAPTGVGYFPEEYADRVERAVAGSPLVDGVAPAIIEQVAMQATGTRQNEPRVTLFASEPERMEGFGTIRAGDAAVSLGDLDPAEGYLNEELARELGVGRGDAVRIIGGGSTASVVVRAVVEYDGTGTDGPALMVGLDTGQRLLGRPGRIKHVLVSNRGGDTSGAEESASVMRLLGPAVAPLGLEADATKQDALELATRPAPPSCPSSRPSARSRSRPGSC
jgi:ABC-type lipoprotein release transport system permease subunit